MGSITRRRSSRLPCLLLSQLHRFCPFVTDAHCCPDISRLSALVTTHPLDVPIAPSSAMATVSAMRQELLVSEAMAEQPEPESGSRWSRLSAFFLLVLGIAVVALTALAVNEWNDGDADDLPQAPLSPPQPLSRTDLSSNFPWLQSPVPAVPGSSHPALRGQQVDPPYTGCTDDTTVHVVFSNHFDLGYRAYQPDGDFAWQVMNQTLHVWLPRALQYERTMVGFNSSVNPHNDSFVWMTQPYILSNLIDCPPFMNFTCPSSQLRRDVLAAMRRGAITWHAFPYNSEAELHSVDQFEFGIELSHRLSDQLGLPRPLTISQRDVPGTTQAMIPLLVKHGIRAFSIGANGWPSDALQYGNVIRWRASTEPAAAETLMLYHGGGYGGIDVHDAVIVKGLKHILLTNWQTDNQGPETPEGFLSDLAFVRQQFPGCRVRTASFDDFVTPLFEAVARGEVELPIVTAEMGDTWIYGASSDPVKMGKYRALTRLRTACELSAECDHSSAAYLNFSRFILKAAEHTWGDYGNGDYSIQIATWVEQRVWAIDVPLQALPAEHPINMQAQAEFDALVPRRPELTGHKQLFGPQGGSTTLGDWSITISADGSITELTDGRRNKQYAAQGQNFLGQLAYQVWDQRSSVSVRAGSRAQQPQADPAIIDSGVAILQSVWLRPGNGSRSAVYSLWLQSVLSPHLVQSWGGWQEAWVHAEFDTDAGCIDYTVSLWDKNSTRQPEGAWFIFSTPPPLSLPLVNKLNTWLPIADVIQGGSRHLHAADFPGVRAVDLFTVSSLDVPFVAIGYVTPLPFPFGNFSDMANARNISWSLVNNAWFTNYPQSYPFLPEDKDIQLRFHLQMH